MVRRARFVSRRDLPAEGFRAGRPNLDGSHHRGERRGPAAGPRREGKLLFAPAADTTLQTGDRLLLYGDRGAISSLQSVEDRYWLSENQEIHHLQTEYRLNERLYSLHLVE